MVVYIVSKIMSRMCDNVGDYGVGTQSLSAETIGTTMHGGNCCNVCCIEVAWFCMARHTYAFGTAICRRKGPPSIFKWQHNRRKPLVMLASYPCSISLRAQTENPATVSSHTAVKTPAAIPTNTRWIQATGMWRRRFGLSHGFCSSISTLLWVLVNPCHCKKLSNKDFQTSRSVATWM